MPVTVIEPEFCQIKDCKRAIKAFGYCTLHRRQLQKHNEITNNHISVLCSTSECPYWAERKGFCFKCSDAKDRAKPEKKAYYKKWRVLNYHRDLNRSRIQMRDQRLKRVYGISMDQYYKILETQQNSCLICKAPANEAKKFFCVDHDHSCCPPNKKTCGKCIRGLLCGNCNRGIGLMQENIQILESAIEYLKGNKTCR